MNQNFHTTSPLSGAFPANPIRILSLLFLVFLSFTSLSHAVWLQTGGTFNVNPNKNAYYPDIALDPTTDYLYVTWCEENASGNRQVYVKYYDGIDWYQLGGSLNNSAAHDVTFPSIAAYNGIPYVTWSESNGNSLNVYVKKYETGTWQAVGGSLNDNPDAEGWYPMIAMDNLVPYVAYNEDSGSGHYRLKVKKYNGGIWEQVGSDLNVDAAKSSSAQYIYIYMGVPYVAFDEVYPGVCYVKYFDGHDWSQIGGSLNININKDAYSPKIFIYSNIPYVSWSESINYYYQIFTAYYNGVWIKDNQPLNIKTDGDSYSGDIKLDSNGIQYVVWSEVTNYNRTLIYVKYNDGSGWKLADGPLNIDDTINATRPRMEIVNNHPFVVWWEQDAFLHIPARVYCKEFIPPTPTNTPTITETSTVSPTPTISATYTITPTYTPTPTVTPTSTASPSVTPTATITPTSTHSPTVTITPTVSPTTTYVFKTKTDEILAYPNPAQGKVNLMIQLDQPGMVKVEVYNIKGELVATIADQFGSAGDQRIEWKSEDVAAGIYLVRITAEGKTYKLKKIAITR